ncbi:FAD-dependent monooxygenase [Nocardia sp. CDC160]|uniref:FAD-dependent monooxygenase n=1 Tax=Nocardia sp. CDC160 TaxID=3112166 RepID=UPI002DB85626|nr:FAD-dependent monooxygenase [Nocardia sp. CDC160]MEC3913971.1 FAD-dependent monooxygenase [Nocardia sp. CDC160]
MSKKALISGAGIAGSTLGYWLGRNGFEVTIVERAKAQRSSGNPIDVKGPAVEVVEAMGVMPKLRAVASRVDRMSFVDTAGRRRSGLRLSAFQGGAGAREVEVARTDLAAILLDSARDRVEIRWGDSISDLTQDAEGVDVGFESGATERYDFVIGADGLHSNVRRLAFGAESEFIHHMGMYAATLPVDRAFGDETEVVMLNQPGRAISVHPAKGKAVAAFLFRRAAVPGFDHRDLSQHKRLVAEAYSEPLDIFADVLDQLKAADDIYFDSVSRISLPHWSSGRIALLGDAGSSLSLFGDGSTLAIAGAHTLAEELTRTPDHPETAFAAYERRHRTLVEPKQRGFRAATALMVPASAAGIAIRNTVTRFLR